MQGDEVTNEKITLLTRANYEYVPPQVTVSDGNEQKIVVTGWKILRPIPTNRCCGSKCPPHTDCGASNSLFDFIRA